MDEHDDTPTVTIALRATVPADDVAPVISRLSAQLALLITEGGDGGGPLSFANVSLDAYVTPPDTAQ